MIIIGIILALVGLAYLCWLLFALAIYALPFFAGVTAGLATYHSGSGPIAAIIVGAIAGSITLICRRRSPSRLSARPSFAQRSRCSSPYRLPSQDIMPHSASRTSAYPPRVGDTPWQ